MTNSAWLGGVLSDWLECHRSSKRRGQRLICKWGAQWQRLLSTCELSSGWESCSVILAWAMRLLGATYLFSSRYWLQAMAVKFFSQFHADDDFGASIFSSHDLTATCIFNTWLPSSYVCTQRYGGGSWMVPGDGSEICSEVSVSCAIFSKNCMTHCQTFL